MGVKPEIFAGRTASFEITKDGTEVFSKLKKGRFPDEGEIVELLGRA